MSYLKKIEKTLREVPRRTVIYGVPGVGKSTFAANMYGRENTIFVQTEDGLANIDVDAFPIAEELMDAWGPVMELGGTVEHKYKAIVVDSADWLEQLIWQQVCNQNGKAAITDFDYGKGYGKATEVFAKFLRALECCRSNGMHVVVVAHSTVVRVSDPNGASYDRYAIKLHKDAEALLHEWADEVLFATYETFITKEDEGFGRERGIAMGDGKRVLKCAERPAYLAKNRLNMPPEIEMRVSEYQNYLQHAGKPNREPVVDEDTAEADSDEEPEAVGAGDCSDKLAWDKN